ncbi:uncharacterized protein LOC120628493 [Pararge aegeria]|uniref:uncharacterized protein LOC120628493 n=1 Tax=Pararge aegeria TaxID=116150 RepID=UPI0019D11F86|nr:uncharacterized protein LOC120628493 [Pararge aegeria]
MAEKFGVADRFNEIKKSAGRDFLTGFFQRHPDLSIRKPEATSINRILGFNKAEVDQFFENLEKVMSKYHFPPSQIYNMDETGVTTVQDTEKIIAPRGQKRIGAVTSWERGKNVTAICAMSASGSFIPPLFIFPRQRHSPQLEKDGPPGAVYTCSHNGWTNESIYIKWLRHFIGFSKPTAEQPVLLIMDNHNSHCTLEAWKVAKANHVVMLSIPPHSSHRLQPLDVTFFGPFKRAYNKECDIFMKSRNMVKITPYDIAGLFNKAYARVASLDKGISGFKATGIFPMNPAVFSEEDFVAVDEVQKLLEQEQPSIEHAVSPSILSELQEKAFPANNTPNMSPNKNPSKVSFMLNNKTVSEPATVNPSTSSSTTNDVQKQSLNTDPTTTNDFAKVLSVISPLPNITNKNKTSRQKQHSVILSSTPMKTVFEEKENKRLEKKNKTEIITKKKAETSNKNRKCSAEKGKKRKKAINKKEKVKRVKKKLFEDETETSEDDDVENLCADESEYSEEETLCAICCDLGKNNEMWYRCRSCGKWAHKQCSGSESPVDYICVFCLEP